MRGFPVNYHNVNKMYKAARLAETPHFALRTRLAGEGQQVLWAPRPGAGAATSRVAPGGSGERRAPASPSLIFLLPPPPPISPLRFLLQIKAAICCDKCSHSPFPSYLLPRREVLWRLTA